jgi:hypothetical protein
LFVSSRAGSCELREFSSEYEYFVSLKISKSLSSGLSSKSFSDGTFVEFFSSLFFADNTSDLSAFGSSKDLEDLSGELKSFDRNNLSLDLFSVYENSLIVEDIDDGNKFAFKSTVVDTSNSSDFYEFTIALNSQEFTI